MGFKENLLRKIEIDRLSRRVCGSIGPADSEKKIDRDAMSRLLALAHYLQRRERDLDLFVRDAASGQSIVVVLDNELPIYHTTVDDVALRKSPTVKEMISIRNAIKILNDGDVKVSRKEASVKTIRQECIARLDLSFKPSDIEAIASDGTVSLERAYSEGVLETLVLFAELLGYAEAPKALRLGHHKVFGRLTPGQQGRASYGPIVIYALIHNTLKLMETPIGINDKAAAEILRQVASGDQKPSLEGPEVFDFLVHQVLSPR